MNFKKASVDFVVISGFVVVLIVGFTAMYQLVNLSAAEGKASRLQQGIADSERALLGVRQSFEQTALFFGLMNTAKELSEQGGVNNPEGVVGEVPEMLTAKNTLFYGVITCDPVLGCKISKRMPFVYSMDADVGLDVESSKKTFPIVLKPDSSNKNYGENLEDVAAGKYKFNLLVQALFLKPGTVTFKACQETRCIQGTLTETGTNTIQLGADVVQKKDVDVILYVWANAKNVAVLRQISVSIYDKDIAANPNQLLTENLNVYRTKLDEIPSDGATYDIKTTPIEALFMPAGTGIYNAFEERRGFVKGIAWWPNKAVEAPDSKVTDWAFAEEDLQTEYWRNYRAAEYFVDIVNTPNLIMPRLIQALNANMNDDFCSPIVLSHGGGYNCPPICAKAYSPEEFRAAMNKGLQSLADELNDLCGGMKISWKLSIPEGVLTADDYTNQLYMSPVMKTTRRHSWSCNCKTSGTPPVRTCSTCSETDYYCSQVFARQYTSNNHNLKILVELTPEKYTIFDSAEKDWVNPTFKFFVEFYPVDDNYCDGRVCSSIPDYVSAPAAPASVSPPPPPDDLLEETMFKCLHSKKQCTDLGGNVVIDTDVKKTRFCKLPGSSCPAGWTRYKSWSTTSPHTCTPCADLGNPHNCRFYDPFNTWGWACTAPGHPWADAGPASCQYFNGQDNGGWLNPCYAQTTEIGCA